jgi:hypothetical protein
MLKFHSSHLQVAIALAAVVAMPCAAQHANKLPWMTGEHLVKLWGNVDPSAVVWSASSPFRTRAIAAEYQDMANGELAHGYILGIHDATEGKAWCWNDKYQPHPDELESDVRNALQRMPDAQLKGNAAELITEVWRKKWPCPNNLQGRTQ